MTGLPIALTCGDPAGIGPEITAKARAALPDLPFFWIGDPAHLPRGTAIREIGSPSEASRVPSSHLPVLPLPFAAPATPGRPAAENAQGVIDSIARAVALVQAGEAAALCTNPIHKKVLRDGAGFAHPGHTEFLAALAGVERVVMMLTCDMLKVVPVTIHIALSEVPAALTPDLLRDTLRLTHDAMRCDFALPTPRLAVSGLNPHAGEGGAMGHEDATIIAPVLEDLRAEGMRISGPHAADTMFHAGARAHYDVAVAMYHDQALIPIKTLDFAGGVNVTLGLPFIRTSPDHGTAFDIAGTGRADPSSLIAALRLARTMARART
ncbi:4-hydroxythreonine-4-phosphate dehydrogenase [Rhodovulum imhoffii]|uniref:4-hydroxythreonine-4-phosphate dehydrogenase n=1 Tax=Rhodovulum imhoffii TaxID=365340 RepID=A0A2T5BVL1_9RHOB|nr:4-hydroxythreonine-4-phosphate dehydrogenase PdxA [Rhodovulum imhoffii]MBK5932815.1 4-hydroxythreonine-4-phosphate dehydrogenase PdxA [Rhodovulum imhoffii]PTN03616.1 4-hydroxythreonine-4-phosphate dehydrogenase [Rhodovulum imhoffii]